MKKKIRIDLLPEDFRGNYKQRFNNAAECPLARAINRKLKAKIASSGSAAGPGHPAYVSNPYFVATYRYVWGEDWDYQIMCNVAKCYAQGDKTIYYVEIEKI